MKKLITLCLFTWFSVFANASITVYDTSICAGTPVLLIATASRSACTASELPIGLRTGLVGYYPFCGNANDESGSGNNGTVSGAVLSSNRYGEANSAYSFNGLADYIFCNRVFYPTFTASIWFNSDTLQAFSPLIDAFDANWELMLINNTPTYISFSSPSTYTGFFSVDTILNHNWYNLVFTYSSSTISLYLNGVLTDVFGVDPLVPIGGVYNFGASLTGVDQFFKGKLDDVGVWNRALSASEIAQIYTFSDSPITYVWSTGDTSSSIIVNPTTTTTYYCTISNGITTSTDTTIVRVRTSSTIINTSICSGQSYLFNGINRITAGSYLDTFTNYTGCDSIVTLNLTVRSTSTGTINRSICSGQSYLFNGVNRTAAGTYRDTFTNYTGCDSIVTLNLNVRSTSTGTINTSICSGQSYLFNGISRTTAGAYRDTFTNYTGCDSIVTLNLTVRSTSTGTINTSICSGQSYLFNGIIRTIAGSYLDTFTNSAGCDSIVTLNLTIEALAISTEPISRTVIVSSNIKFAVSTSTIGAVYQWQSDLGIGFQNLLSVEQYLGTNTDTLTVLSVTTANNNQPFRCIVSFGPCADTSLVAFCRVTFNNTIGEMSHLQIFKIYPNPASKFTNIDIDESLKGMSYVFLDATGQIVLSGKLFDKSNLINTSELASGLYIVKVGNNIAKITITQ